MPPVVIQIAYLASAILFILGLKGLTSPATARRGMLYAEIGMLVAIIGTLLQHEIVRFDWILVGLVAGSAIGAPIAIYMPMTAVPQRTAISHMCGALAATLVGVAEYWRMGGQVPHVEMAALGFEVLFGSLTITGSFMAFGKLQELIKGAPVTYRGQNTVNITLFLGTLGLFAYLIAVPGARPLFYAMVALGLLIGVFIVLPIGGADMPVVISLLNSYAG
ncbi:MAG TPA: NAD(P)(+) transhydrogenase (Re/Si-specific) subunit beta, partial [Gemmatimonadales bacterium]|nr:NAD(P)(+) transhydrogenase (Re/Si-specific) subunit beta [Gemmatimonadales bacterium]